jgi:hypothetical protein
LSLAGNVTQAAQIRFAHERGTQQTRARQAGQPLGVNHIGLANRHRFEVVGIDYPSHDSN